MTHWWRVKKTRPDRYASPCRVIAYGSLNSVLVEFADGERVVASRWAVRKLPPSQGRD